MSLILGLVLTVTPMATFAKKSFNAAIYSSFRPTYPIQLFKEIFDFHRLGNASWNTAVDLGCGTGMYVSFIA